MMSDVVDTCNAQFVRKMKLHNFSELRVFERYVAVCLSRNLRCKDPNRTESIKRKIR